MHLVHIITSVFTVQFQLGEQTGKVPFFAERGGRLAPDAGERSGEDFRGIIAVAEGYIKYAAVGLYEFAGAACDAAARDVVSRADAESVPEQLLEP